MCFICVARTSHRIVNLADPPRLRCVSSLFLVLCVFRLVRFLGPTKSSLHEKCAFSLHVSLQQQQQQQQQRHHQQVQQGGAGGSNAGRDGVASGGMDVSEVRGGI